MSKRRFTIYDGPDKGMTFVPGDSPLTLGRAGEGELDVALHDDRASRLHARIVVEGDDVVILDENSSNGTFVNGELISRHALQWGDVIQIGANHISYGRERPADARAASGRKGTRAPLGIAAQGNDTDVMPGPDATAPVNPVETHLGEVLNAIADAAQPDGKRHGVALSVESDLKPDIVTVDGGLIHAALAGIVAEILKTLGREQRADGTTGGHRMLVLRAGHDPAGGGFEIEIIGIGLPVLADRVVADAGKDAFRAAAAVARAHEGVLELAPRDSKDILVRMRLPSGLGRTTQATVIST